MNNNDGLIDSVRESFGRVVYTHKTHEKAADILVEKAKNWKLMETLLLVVTATSVITVLCGGGRSAEIIASIFSALALGVSIYQYRFISESEITGHRICSRNLWLIREKLTCLLSDLVDGAITDAEARSRREQLTSELHCIYETAPQTDRQAYQAAQKALQKEEDMTFSEEEIDRFLPPALRRSSQKNR